MTNDKPQGSNIWHPPWIFPKAVLVPEQEKEPQKKEIEPEIPYVSKETKWNPLFVWSWKKPIEKKHLSGERRRCDANMDWLVKQPNWVVRVMPHSLFK